MTQQELAKQILAVYIKYYEIVLNEKGKIATRKTIESLTGDIKTGLTDINVKVITAVSLLYIEFGRRAGAKMPPSGSLDDWYAAVGIDPKLDYVIRRSIARKGIKPTPITQPVIDAAQGEIDELVGRYMELGIVGDLVTNIQAIYKTI